jgi:23S rRNA (cytosine1962-C5)-methyltransferase
VPPDAIWHVSAAVARAVRRGHPWILPDDETAPVARWHPGTLVEAVDPGGDSLGLARIDGPGAVAARIWTRSAGHRVAEGSVADRVAAALARRKSLVAPAGGADGGPPTDALRLVHGEADGLPGLHVDRLGPILRMLVTSEGAAHALVDPVAEALVAARGEGAGHAGPVEAIVRVLHLRDRPGGDRVRPVRVESWPGLPGAEALLDDRGRLSVRERGLVFHVDPGLREPRRPRPGVGLYLDQRENRERLAAEARRGGRWLNLFAHTGAFSVALLAAGAEAVVSVDLSRPYLAWLEENLAANRDRGVDAGRHEAVRRDGRRFLAERPPSERFAGIVLDPPTAAAAGRRFWSTRRDLEPLVGEALARLEPGGVLLVARNQRRARPDLAALVHSAARARRIALADVSRADPGPDFPRLRGFREGDSFRGVLARRR